jgi:hypothetical protein
MHAFYIHIYMCLIFLLAIDTETFVLCGYIDMDECDKKHLVFCVINRSEKTREFLNHACIFIYIIPASKNPFVYSVPMWMMQYKDWVDASCTPCEIFNVAW